MASDYLYFNKKARELNVENEKSILIMDFGSIANYFNESVKHIREEDSTLKILLDSWLDINSNKKELKRMGFSKKDIINIRNGFVIFEINDEYKNKSSFKYFKKGNTKLFRFAYHSKKVGDAIIKVKNIEIIYHSVTNIVLPFLIDGKIDFKNLQSFFSHTLIGVFSTITAEIIVGAVFAKFLAGAAIAASAKFIIVALTIAILSYTISKSIDKIILLILNDKELVKKLGIIYNTGKWLYTDRGTMFLMRYLKY